MLLVHPDAEVSISVVITNHRYEEYLEEALKSIINQTASPKEVIVIDDKPENDEAKDITKRYEPLCQYHRVQFGHPLKSREHGFSQTTSKYVCFLDADDVMDRNYLQGATHALVDNPETKVVYSDIYYFKDGSVGRTYLNKTNYSESIPRKRISQTNFLHVGCITDRIAIEASDAFNHGASYTDSYNHGTPYTDYHEDWMFWRKVLSTGCKYTKQNVPYFARKHDRNRSRKLEEERGYYHLRGIDLATITYAGIGEPKEDDLFCEIDWVNAIQSNYRWRFKAMLFNDRPTARPREVSHFPERDRRTIVNKVARSATSDYVFFYREDNPPTMGTLQSMFRLLGPDVAIIHKKGYELFECTLVVNDVLCDYYYYDLEQLPFGDNERIIEV